MGLSKAVDLEISQPRSSRTSSYLLSYSCHSHAAMSSDSNEIHSPSEKDRSSPTLQLSDSTDARPTEEPAFMNGADGYISTLKSGSAARKNVKAVNASQREGDEASTKTASAAGRFFNLLLYMPPTRDQTKASRKDNKPPRAAGH
jgi:hypothetical protein